MNTFPSRYALDEEVEAELSAPKVTTPAWADRFAPKTEADRARAWLSSLDLDNLQNNDIEHAEFYKHEVAVLRGEKVFYLSTRSPQQKTWRRSLGTTYARGTREDILDGLERFIKQMEAKVTRRNDLRDAKREARAAFVNPYTVGDFLNSSWGYDQTNKEFYQVLEVRPLTLKICEVYQNRETTGYDSGTCVPIPNRFKGESRWVTIQVNKDGHHWINSPEYGHLYAWDGKPEYWSSYA